MNAKYVVSLEIAKRMVNAGWQKETKFWWCGIYVAATTEPELFVKITDIFVNMNSLNSCGRYELQECIPAPLSDEILEELPECFESSLGSCTFTIEKVGISYFTGYELLKNPHKSPLYKQADTLPDALGELWIIMQKIKEEKNK